MVIAVELGSSADGNRHPVAIRFGQRRVQVLEVEDRWYGREQTWWKVRTEEGRYVLAHDENEGRWDLAAVVAPDDLPPAVLTPRAGTPPQ